MKKGELMKKHKLIIIAGPTATGKTKVAVNIAKQIDGEIISADSMQVYKYMDIGTAKVTKSEMGGIKHYLIDEVLPDEEYSVADFKKKATMHIEDIVSRGKVPILVGGTGFYINSLVYNNEFVGTKSDAVYRKELEKLAKIKGNLYVHNKLKEVDEVSAMLIHENNVKRVIRALEFYSQTGIKFSTHNENEKKRQQYYDTYFNILNMERSTLYKKIDQRVEFMVNKGFVEEVIKLKNMGYDDNLPSMKSIGYKQIVMYINKEITLEYAIELIKRETRRFAKRQLTWFNNQTYGNWVDSDNNVKDIIKNIALPKQ
jgi:tRNA dimethylallyltransferase